MTFQILHNIEYYLSFLKLILVNLNLVVQAVYEV
jgi:hypothetical protein